MAVVEQGEELRAETPGRKPGTRSRRVTAIVSLALVLLFPLIAYPIFDSYAYVMQLGMLLLMWIAMSSSWNILGGFAGYISLGHGLFYAIGGYSAGLALAHWGISPFMFLPLAGLAAMAVGFLAGLITLRTRGRLSSWRPSRCSSWGSSPSTTGSSSAPPAVSTCPCSSSRSSSSKCPSTTPWP